jgi:hypothetical protein
MQRVARPTAAHTIDQRSSVNERDAYNRHERRLFITFPAPD